MWSVLLEEDHVSIGGSLDGNPEYVLIVGFLPTTELFFIFQVKSRYTFMLLVVDHFSGLYLVRYLFCSDLHSGLSNI